MQSLCAPYNSRQDIGLLPFQLRRLWAELQKLLPVHQLLRHLLRVPHEQGWERDSLVWLSHDARLLLWVQRHSRRFFLGRDQGDRARHHKELPKASDLRHLRLLKMKWPIVSSIMPRRCWCLQLSKSPQRAYFHPQSDDGGAQLSVSIHLIANQKYPKLSLCIRFCCCGWWCCQPAVRKVFHVLVWGGWYLVSLDSD